MADDQKNSKDNKDLAAKQAAGSAAPKAAQPQAAAVPPAKPAQPAAQAATGTPAPGAAPAAASVQVSNLEDGAISEKVQIVLVNPYNETVGKLKDHFNSQEGRNKVHEANNVTAPQIARQLMPCLLVGSISQNNDVVRLLSMLKAVSKEVKKNNIKFIVLSKIKNHAIIKTFEDLGCHEYIVEPIADRSLKFKIDLQTKAIHAQRKHKRKQELAKAESGKPADGEDAKKDAADPNDPNAKGELSLKKAGEEKEEDKWVFKTNKVKKEGKKYTMRMKGPDPGDGEWLEVEKSEDGESQWRFMEKEEDPKNPKKKDAVQWKGDKPQFKNGEWEMSGEKPDLAVVDESGKKKESKISSDADGLNIGKDSRMPAWKIKEKFQEAEEVKDPKEAAKEAKNGDAATSKDNTGLAGMAMDFEDGPAGLNNKLGDEKDPRKKRSGMGGLEDDELLGDEAKKEAKVGMGTGGGGKAKKGKGGLGQIDDEDLGGDEKKKSENTSLAGMAMDFEDGPKDINNKLGDEKDTKKKRSGMGGLEDNEDLGADGKKKDNTGLAGMAMDFEDGPKDVNNKLGEGKDPKKKRSGMGGLEDNEDLGGEPTQEGKAGMGTGGAGSKAKKGKGGLGQVDDEDLGGPDVPKKKKAFGSIDDEDLGGDEKKKDNTALAGMAMDFEEDPASYGKDLKPDEKAAIGGKDKAKTEKINSSEWDGHNLSPEELAKKKKKKADDSDDADQKPKKKKAFGSVDDEDLGEDDDTEDLSAGDKNFLGGELDSKPEFNDDQKPDDDNAGGGAFYDEISPKAGRKWGGKDSDQSEEEEDEEDKVIEIDAVSGSLKVKEGAEETTFEYSADHFGTPNGTWESAGVEGKGADGKKFFVFIDPKIRTEKGFDVKKVAKWWVYRHDSRPQFQNKLKKWVFKGTRPYEVVGFDNLPDVVRSFLLSICPLNAAEKKAEDAAKEKEQSEAKKKAREEAKEEAKKKRAEDVELDASGKPKKRAEEDDEDLGGEKKPKGKNAGAGDEDGDEELGSESKSKGKKGTSAAEDDEDLGGAEGKKKSSAKGGGKEDDEDLGEGGAKKKGKGTTEGDSAATESASAKKKKSSASVEDDEDLGTSGIKSKKGAKADSAADSTADADEKKKSKSGSKASEDDEDFGAGKKSEKKPTRDASGENNDGEPEIEEKPGGKSGKSSKGGTAAEDEEDLGAGSSKKKNKDAAKGAKEDDEEFAEFPRKGKDKDSKAAQGEEDAAEDSDEFSHDAEKKGKDAGSGAADDDEDFGSSPKKKAGESAKDAKSEGKAGKASDEDVGAEAGSAESGEVTETAAAEAAKKGGGAVGEIANDPDGKGAGGEQSLDTTKAPPKAKGLGGRLPSSPMVAVVLSEMILFSKGDFSGALSRYCAFLGDSFGGVKVSVYALGGETTGRLIATNDEALVVGSDRNFGSDQIAREAIDKRVPNEVTDGLIFCPILQLASDGNVTMTSSRPQGLLVIDPQGGSKGLGGRLRYFQGVAQCLRGVVAQVGKQAWSAGHGKAGKKEAA